MLEGAYSIASAPARWSLLSLHRYYTFQSLLYSRSIIDVVHVEQSGGRHRIVTTGPHTFVQQQNYRIRVVPIMFKASGLRSRLQSNRREMRNFLGWLILAVFTLVITALVELPRTLALSSVSVFLLASGIELLVAVFGLPTALREIFPGILLLVLCFRLILNGGSPLLVVGFAFASGWGLHAAVSSFS